MRVYLGGSFDLIHSGHLYTLRYARALGDELVVGLNSDDFIERFKGHPPVQPYEERCEVLSALRDVDRVVLNVGGEDSRPILEAVMPDVLVAGPDWYSEDHSRYCRQMGFTLDWLGERGIRLVYVPRLAPGRSSTNLRSTARAIA